MSSITINTNLAALNTQRRLGQSTAALGLSFERLSSGLRINRASDDAAGLAVAAGLNVDRHVFAQAVRNINNGIGYLNVAEGAAGELTGTLIRLRELATQSANGTISQSQRQALDKEAQALRNEYNRIIETAEFNGVQVLKAEELVLQAGYAETGRLVASLSASHTVTAGDGTFQAAQAYAVGSSPRSVFAGDFSGNGVIDLVTADGNSNTVSVLLGNGDGTFQAAQDYAVGTLPSSVFAGDFNGNGVLDLVTADRNSNQVSVLLGNGDGTFQAGQSYAAGSAPLSVFAADFNGDGVLDLATANQNSDTVSVLLGNGDGSFQAAQSYAVGDNPDSVFSADFNGNGMLDLVTADRQSDAVSVLLGNGDGTFQTAQNYTVGDRPRSVFSGDFNGNGVLDLVTADSSSNTVSVLLGNGDGTFQAAQSYAAGSGAFGVFAADFNGNGVLDAVTADRFSNKVSVLLGNGDGTFQAPQSYALAGSQPFSVFVGDFNGDGVLDVVTADGSSNAVSVLLGNAVTTTQSVGIRPLSGVSVANRISALESQETIDGYIEEVGIVAGIIGAAVSRFEAAARTLAVSAENFQAAESRIADADIAEEAADLVKNRILQQAGAAVLAQANQAPELALTLL